MATEDATALPDLGAVAVAPEPAPNGGAPAEPTPEEVSPEVKAEAALDEENKKKVTYRVKDSSLDLELPPKLKASVMFRAGILRDDDGAGAARLIQSVLGDEQFDAVMDQMDDAGLTIDDEEALTSLGTLLNDALAKYGMTPGESQASQNS